MPNADRLRQIRERVTVSDAAAVSACSVAGERAKLLTPCPACGAEKRGTADRRWPVRITSNGGGWRCYACGAGGSAIDVLLLARHGHKDWRALNADERTLFLSLAADRGWCDPLPVSASEADKRKDAEAMQARRRQATERPPAQREAPELLPAEATCWWQECDTVDKDSEASGYLRGRGIDPLAVADADAARIMPAGGGSLRARVTYGGATYDEVGWRLVVPFYDASGTLRAFQAGRTRELAPDLRKAMTLRGTSTRGRVMTYGLGLTILREGLPSWWPSEAPCDVVITEGLPDYLSAVSVLPEAWETAPAVFGVLAGSWTDELAERLPARARVTIHTHKDRAGDTYAAAISATLSKTGQTIQRGYL